MRSGPLRFLSAALLAAAIASACGRGADPPSSASVSPAPAEQAGPAGAPDGPVVVMLGDSLTAGYRLPPEAALPETLARALSASGAPVRMINAGVSGDTSADGLNRYEWSVKAASPDLLILALGANDFLNDLPPEETRANLRAILERARADGIRVALLGLSPPPDLSRLRPDKAGFAAIYPDLADAFGAPLLPDMLAPLGGRPELVMSDGLHPTEAGVEAMAAAIADFLAPVVSSLSPAEGAGPAQEE